MPESKPMYSAVLVQSENGDDLGPVDVSDAKDCREAVDVGKRRAPVLLRELGLDRAFLRVGCDGQSLGHFKVRC